LEALAELKRNRFIGAEKLRSLLVEEGKRWVETLAILQELIKNSVGDFFHTSSLYFILRTVHWFISTKNNYSIF
jgi:hypothetical protein